MLTAKIISTCLTALRQSYESSISVKYVDELSSSYQQRQRADIENAISALENELEKFSSPITNDSYGGLLHSQILTIGDLFKTQGKIAAIKEYRRIMNCGLKVAKDEVEAFARVYQWRGPWS